MVYADPARGCRCFSHPGGSVGGRIYDLAFALRGGQVGTALLGTAFVAAKHSLEEMAGEPGIGSRARWYDQRL